jgi:hypothetical protein
MWPKSTGPCSPSSQIASAPAGPDQVDEIGAVDAADREHRLSGRELLLDPIGADLGHGACLPWVARDRSGGDHSQLKRPPPAGSRPGMPAGVSAARII